MKTVNKVENYNKRNNNIQKGHFEAVNGVIENFCYISLI